MLICYPVSPFFECRRFGFVVECLAQVCCVLCVSSIHTTLSAPLLLSVAVEQSRVHHSFDVYIFRVLHFRGTVEESSFV